MDDKFQIVVAFKGLTKNIISFFENSLIEEKKISCSELNILKTIKEVNDKQLNVTELSLILKMSKSAVSQAISKLEKKNLVKKKSDLFDKKVYHIVLTDKAEKLYLKHNKEYLETLKKVSMEMGEADINELSRLLEKLSNIINRLGKEQVGC